MSEAYSDPASDWSFDSVAEFDSQVDPRFHSAGARMFHFHSPLNALSAFVIFTGRGIGSGLKFSWNKSTLHVALESIEALAKPSIGKEVKISMPRQKAKSLMLQKLTIKDPFSLQDLHGARGYLATAGVGAGVGVGAFVASAEANGQQLFACQRLGVEFGRLGASTNALTGYWLVGGTWDD